MQIIALMSCHVVFVIVTQHAPSKTAFAKLVFAWNERLYFDVCRRIKQRYAKLHARHRACVWEVLKRGEPVAQMASWT